MKPAAPSRIDEEPGEASPGDLKIVEAFVNTRDRATGAEALPDLWSLNLWMLRCDLLEKVTLEASDLIQAYEVREALWVLLAHKASTDIDPKTIEVLDRAAAQGELRLRFDVDGRIRLQSRERDFEGALGQLLGYVVMAQQGDLWSRLKICGACNRVFFDSSETRRIQWCSPRCGGRVRCRNFPRRP